ncbi:MAG: glucosaminidase domain-containing protein [candidate division WOR-3 bacterium]
MKQDKMIFTSKQVEIKHTPLKQKNEDILVFINKLKDLHKKNNCKLPFTYHLTICGLETRNGEAVYNYNLYNITGEYQGKYFKHKNIDLKFRAYNSFDESIKDFEDLIHNKYKSVITYLKENKIEQAIKETILLGFAGHKDYERYLSYLIGVKKYV